MSEAEVDSFNMPFYDPDEGEVRKIIRNEGSFEIDKIETHEFDLGESNGEEDDMLERSKTGKRETSCIRAVSEPLLVAHFGDAIIDTLFTKFAQHVVQHANCLNETTITLVVSLTKI